MPAWLIPAIVATFAAAGVQQQRQSNKAQEKAAKKQAKMAAIENARARRRTIAESISQKANIEAQSEVSGTGGSSAEAGAIGSLRTQTASNISFQQQLESLDMGRLRNLRSAASFQSNAATAEAVGTFTATGAGFSSSGQAIGSLFK